MTLRKLLTGAAIAAVAGVALPATHAQTLTVTETTTGTYSYAYTVTPSISINELLFNFSDTNFTSETGSGPLTLSAALSTPSGGVFGFSGGTLAAGSSEVFTFVSPDGPGGTVGATGISFAGSGVAALNGITPAPAPEPGSLVSMAVLGACLGLGIVARRRKTLVN